MKLVDADALIEQLTINPEECPGCPEPEWLEDFIDMLDSAQEVDIESIRPTAHWVYDENGMDWNLGAWVCSECRFRNDNIPPSMVFKGEHVKINPYDWAGSKYCPNCGRRMTREGET